MALNLTDALSQYGFVGDLANSIPELRAIFLRAAKEEWDPAKFERAVMDSSWYRRSSESYRALIVQQTTDPATYRQSLRNGADKILMLEREMGLVPMPQSTREALARHFLINNYDDEQIHRWLGLNGRQNRSGEGKLAGQVADLDGQMREVASAFGVSVTEKFLSDEIRKIQSGDDTFDGFESLMRVRAKAAFPQFAAQIDAGMTVRDIADPYISTMANTLEVAETEVDLKDPWVRKALSQKQPDGRQDAMPLWQFERQLKDDPRWDKTKQARQQAYDTIAQVGRDFGFEA